MDADASGNTVVDMVPNYQIHGKTGTWLPYDSEDVEGVCFFMMRNEQRKDTRAYVPREAIRRMWSQSSFPTFDEGFNEIYRIDKNNNLHYLVNCAVVNGRISESNGKIIKQIYC